MQVAIIPRIADADPAQWDALVGPDDPFAEHAFLHALEASESVCAEAGWLPCHVVVEEAGRLVAATPLYVKAHSYGEYIFDWGWADAAQRAGLRYYPKLVSAVPFTPVTGPRLLLGGPPLPGDPRVTALLAGMRAAAEQVEASSLHVLFCTEPEQQALVAQGRLFPRLTWQFHWENQGYSDFDHWLSTFRSKDRKNARRERRLPPGVTTRVVPGVELTDREVQAIYGFYRDTVDRKGGWDYLNREYFEALRGPLAPRVLVTTAEAEGQIVSAALLFQKGGGLYGRSWGCQPGYQGLHFELCYHLPISLCIARGWTRFEAGAQGMHKLKRGLMPSPTYSAHWIAHPGLSEAVRQAVQREAALNERQMAALADHGPFHRDEPGDEPG